MSVCVEVQVRWGDHVLQVRHLRPARTFRLGEAIEGPGACDLFVPREYVGSDSVPVVLQGPGVLLRAIVPPSADARVELSSGNAFSKAAATAQGILEPCPDVQGALQVWLHPGVRVCSWLARGSQGEDRGPYRRAGAERDDALVVSVGWVEPERRMDRNLLSWPSWMQWTSIAATVLAHATLLFWIALAMPTLGPTDNPLHERNDPLLMHMPLISMQPEDGEEQEPEPTSEGEFEGTPWEATRCGEEGAMGLPSWPQTKRRYGVAGPQDNPDPHIARQTGEWPGWGSYIGLEPDRFGAARDQHTAPWGRDDSLGVDAKSARGAMFGAAIGTNQGRGGLSPGNVGEGGRTGFSRATGKAPVCESPSAGARADSSVHPGTPTVSGATPLQAIRRVVQAHAGRFRHCADAALRANPGLHGQVMIQARIGEGGEIESVGSSGSSLVEQDVVQCMVQTFGTLSFPDVTGGAVDVVYPMVITAGG
ncbi:MAG: AgmX/PglI C-terminal domain-containing protein [Deltaproteobacteria bacterium]|nr:AgmX/PglI C-terminal domain-containing protein [Deltaproteobacteria bacterium]